MLYAHPFAEEMNKSRRMARLQASEFANAGFAVLQIDLFGCGDSAGNFADATWDDWVNDLRCGANWLQETVAAPLWLWGLRAGCLLLAATAAGIKSPVSYLFWQPPPSGRVLLQQFLRLRLAADMRFGKNKGAMERLRSNLRDAGSIEIVGYELSYTLATGLENAALVMPIFPTVVHWLELTHLGSDSELLPASVKLIEHWRESGSKVHTQVIRGPQFWQVGEIEDAPTLLQVSVAAAIGGGCDVID